MPMKKKFLVATGIVVFTVTAASEWEAIDELKKRIDARRYAHTDPEIGMSLVHAYDRGDLNYVVMDEQRTQLLCGELKGQFQQRVTRTLADALRASIPD